MNPIGRLLALALVSLLAFTACTDEESPPAATGGGSTNSATPTPAQTFTGAPGTATYTYVLDDLTVTVELDGSEGTMQVENDSEQDLGAPDLSVLDAADGREIDGEVVGSTRVAAGDSATFDVRLDGVTVEDIGLLLLRFGSEDFGALVRTA
jgi:hypothetical protein